METENYQEFIDLAAQFGKKELEAFEAANEENQTFDKAVFRKAGDAGLTGLAAPEAHGGMGLGYAIYARILEELAVYSSSFAVTVAVNGLPQIILDKFASDEQKKMWLPAFASGERLGGFALTEPHCGSDSSALKTTARKSNGDYILNGTKQFITHAGVGDAFMVLARTGGLGSRGISCFYVEADSPGLTAGKKESKMGWRTSPTGSLIFEDVRVPEFNLIGREGAGFKVAMQALDSGRITIAASAVGIARRALAEAVSYMKTRTAFGNELAELQGLQWMIADMDTAVAAARLLVIHAAKLKDAGREYSREASQAKLFATDTAMRVTTDAVQILGGYGYCKEYPVERLMRDAKATQIVEGTNQIQRNIIAKAILRSGAAILPGL